MKKLLAILLCIMLLATTLLSGCSVKTKDQLQQQNDTNTSTEGKEPVKINLLSLSLFETEANVVRDQLKKAGFDVTLNIQPDYSSFFTQVDARNYDIQLLSMKVLTGNPDYAVRSMLRSDGEDNASRVVDPEVDKLIDLGASLLPADALDVYKQLEEVVVDKNAYFAPVCRMMNNYGFNKEIVKEDTMSVGQSKYQYWREIDYVDSSLRDTQPLLLTQNQAVGQFDTVTQNGTFKIVANTNIKLLELTDDDQITTDGSLSRNYSIAEGNDTFYFVLRDDVKFAKSENKKIVDTGIRVGADDVLFTVNRLMNKDSVPGHKVYDNYQIVKGIERVTDINELMSINESGSGKTVKEALESQLSTPIKELVNDKNSVNNTDGKYEVVKLTTKQSFPQIVNFLCGYDAGIVCKEQVEKINNFDVSKFDPNKDIRYGDAKCIKEGTSYDNHLYSSGPYAVAYANDYEVVAEKNPGYMPDSEFAGKIKTVKIKIITDQDAAISALRSGEVHIADVPSNLVSVVKNEPKLGIVSNLINGVVNIQFNLDEGKVTNNVDIRKAILYAINQDEIVAVKEGMAGKAYTCLTMLDTGKVHNADPEKVKQHLDNYYKSLEK